MRGHNVCLYGERRKIISNLSSITIFNWNSASVHFRQFELAYTKIWSGVNLWSGALVWSGFWSIFLE